MPDKQRDNHIKTLEAAGKSGSPGTNSPRDKNPNPKQQKSPKKKK